jgi:hypothetical protein
MRNRNFERWYARRIKVPLLEVEAMWDGSTYTSYNYHVEIAWSAWCAALGFEQGDSNG